MNHQIEKRLADERIIRACLTSGVAVGAVMMLISYWMDAHGLANGTDALSLRPLWIYSFSLILAMIGVPVMCAGLWAWAWIIHSIKAEKWATILFWMSAVSYAVSSCNCLDTPVNHMQWAVPEERGESLQKDFCFAFWPCRYKT